MRGSKLTTAIMVIAMLTVAMVPGAVGAASTEESLQVSVTQDVETGNATVTVTQNDTNNTAVDNATVEIVESSVEYSANNTSYTTDANGTVELPNPEERVNVTLNVTPEGNNTTTESFEAELVPHDESLDVSVEHDDANDTLTATVTQYGDEVENASVEVNGTDYNESGETDENGTIQFAEPANSTNLTFVATANGEEAETTVSVDADDLEVTVTQDENSSVEILVTDDDEAVENATVTVESDSNYTETGEYMTDENGTVELDDPLQNVTINVTAEYDNMTAQTTATLQGDVAEEDPFGALVSSFVERLKQQTVDGPMGQAVSDFVTENNPGKADEKRPDHAGQKDKGKDKQQGPPEHAQNGNDDADSTDDETAEETTTTEDDSEDSDDEDSDDEEEKSNNGNGNGNGKGN